MNKVYIVMQAYEGYMDVPQIMIGVASSLDEAKKLAEFAEPIGWAESEVYVKCYEVDRKRIPFNELSASEDWIKIREVPRR